MQTTKALQNNTNRFNIGGGTVWNPSSKKKKKDRGKIDKNYNSNKSSFQGNEN